MDVLGVIRLTQGKSNTAYRDSVRGVWTVGYGCTGPDVAEGTHWTDEQCEDALVRRAQFAEAQARGIVGMATWAAMGDVRRAALTDATYSLGAAGLGKFRIALSAVRSGDWETAADQFVYADAEKTRPSQWHEQAPRETGIVAGMLRLNQWPSEDI